MNDDERTFEAVRMVHILAGKMRDLKPEVTAKFRKAVKYPYIIRYEHTDDRMNTWRMLFILPNKWYKKKRLFRAWCGGSRIGDGVQPPAGGYTLSRSDRPYHT